MAKSLLKLLLLGGLSMGASNLPGLLGGLSGLPGGKAPAFAVPGGSDESSSELRRELADLQGTMEDLKGLAGGRRARAAAGLSAEERELMADAAPKLEFKDNALTRQLGLAPGGAGAAAAAQLPGGAGKVMKRLRQAKAPEFQNFADFRGGMLRWYSANQGTMAYVLWAAPAGTLALAFLLFLCKRYTVSMLFTGWVFLLANFLIWALSAAVLFSAVLTKQSLLAALPRELWLSPVVFLVASAGMLRLADENYPFWNRTVSTLFTPIAASALAAFWPAGVQYAKGLLGAAAAKA